MSSIAIQGNAAGAGVFTVAAPNSSSSYTLTLPTATTTLVGTDATQTLTNKTIQGGTITSGTAVASTSGTSIDFTSVPSWVKRITVMFSGVSTNGTSNVQVQIGSGSVTTSGYTNGRLDSSGASVATNNATSGFVIYVPNAASDVFQGQLILNLLGSNAYVGAGFVTTSNARSTNNSGAITLGGTLDRIRITTVNGTDTFDAGFINILYE